MPAPFFTASSLQQTSYLKATQHPWPCLLFLLPLLAGYEGGVIWLGGTQPDALRNGADAWLHWALDAFGLSQLYWAPAFIVLLLFIWSWNRRDDRPTDLFGVCAGMAIESVACALGLWLISRELGPTLDGLGIELAAGASPNPALAQIISFVGAGIYEEVLFRLLLFSVLVWLLQEMEISVPLAVLLAAIASAAIFSAAHHIGPYGERFNGYAFLFRSLAGLYFALLFKLRGFGVAVGAHVCYDVLVGVVVG